MKKKKAITEDPDAIFIARKLSKKEQKIADQELAIARIKSQALLTDQDRLEARILQFKLKLMTYLKQENFTTGMKFSSVLQEYVAIQEKKQRTFADEVDVKETELSQFLNDHRSPPEYFIIRLEIHSNNSIPANWWYRLIEKEREHFIKTDIKIRQEQKKHVTNKLGFTV